MIKTISREQLEITVEQTDIIPKGHKVTRIGENAVYQNDFLVWEGLGEELNPKLYTSLGSTPATGKGFIVEHWRNGTCLTRIEGASFDAWTVYDFLLGLGMEGLEPLEI